MRRKTNRIIEKCWHELLSPFLWNGPPAELNTQHSWDALSSYGERDKEVD